MSWLFLKRFFMNVNFFFFVIFELYGLCLLLCVWCDSDCEVFVEMCVDLQVMEFFFSVFDCVQSDVLVDCVQVYFVECGYGFWVLELLGEVVFIGFIGLFDVIMDVYFVLIVEIGWCLVFVYWGCGFVCEVVEIVLDFVFEWLCLFEVVVFIMLFNCCFWGLMECLGMCCDLVEDFDYLFLVVDYLMCWYIFYCVDVVCWVEW